MASPYNPQQLQWADDVRRLHALWHHHHGPPNPPPDPLPQNTEQQQPNPEPPPVLLRIKSTPQGIAKATASRAHYNALLSSQEFFTNDTDLEQAESAVFEFFSGLFKNDPELRGYYEKRLEEGEFCCLVCEGVSGVKKRRFDSCLGLVKHARMVLEGELVVGHRGFARAVAVVVGWDFDDLPTNAGKTQKITVDSENTSLAIAEELAEELPSKDSEDGDYNVSDDDSSSNG